jgi:hypothetical protein
MKIYSSVAEIDESVLIDEHTPHKGLHGATRLCSSVNR